MEVLKITLPDGESVFTHDLDDAHTQRIIRHWVDRHSDEYELPGIHKAQQMERARDKETGEWLFENVATGQIVKSKDGDAHVRPGSTLRPIRESVERVAYVEEGTGKKRPTCDFELVEMPEEQYRAMTTYRYFETCKVAA